MQPLVLLFNTFSGPIGALVEKGILAAVMYAAGKGWIAGDVTGIAATLYTAVSTVFTGIINSRTGKIVAVNSDTSNGVKVVPDSVPVRPVDGPIVQ
jgi:hypothetical protein